MILSEHDQLTEGWYKERAGLPTASKFDVIVTSKGEPSKSAKKYMYTLAGEKITGVKENGYTNQAMERGIQLESEARSLYELMTGNTAEQVGLCWKDEKKLVGASVDGLVGDGCLEIKCPSLAVHVEYLLQDKLPTAYYQQVQGQLYVTGRKWADFVSYYPSMRLFIKRVERDEAFIEKLNEQLNLFVKELEVIVNKIK